MAAARQMATELAQVCARAVTESLINMTGEGVSASAEIQYPSSAPRLKGRHVSSFVLQSVKPQSRGVIHIDNALCCALLERACGGQGIVEEPVELLTLAESRFAERVVSLTLELISRSLDMDESMYLVKEREAESSLDLSRNMFLLQLKVSTDDFTGSMSVWLPGEVITPSLETKPLDQDALREVVTTLPVSVTAILSRQKSSLGKVLNLKVGDVLPLTLPGTAEVRTGNRMLCQAKVVARNGQLALELQDAIKGNKETQL